ncbi:MAG: 1-(5-phosphoribosyl)-5-[(5-phosphoribosylamino)methylideneamino]imidazole-4-carboxamide isomerase [Candidatus Omnitrophica bacterium]|nr:1-(5-phosphoribosyl)-5-[(5-phosphoribosylamino)methylideneamino]imidazole-4-carboxamide isomerase [Candidatus Omnitrophota bacterium]
MRIYPAIDLIGGRTVRLEQGRYDRELRYDIDPVEAATRWKGQGAEYIHIVDLDGARSGRPVNLDTVCHIVSAIGDLPLQVGGGYRTTEDIDKALNIGVERVIVGSRAFRDPDFAIECARVYGRRVIFSVDARSGQIMSEGWELESGSDDIGMIEKFVNDCGVPEIIYTDISKDGMLTGPDLNNLRRILSRVKVRLISAGGIRTVEHIEQLRSLEPEGVSGAIVGRALYEGTIDLKEAIHAGKKDNPLS